MYLIGIYYSNELCMHSTLVHFIGASNSYKNFFCCQKWEIVQFFCLKLNTFWWKFLNCNTVVAGAAKMGGHMTPEELKQGRLRNTSNFL